MNLNVQPISKGALSVSAQSLLAAWATLGYPKRIDSDAVMNTAAVKMDQIKGAIVELIFAQLIYEEDGGYKITPIGKKKLKVLLPAEKKATKYNIDEFATAFIEEINTQKKKYLGKKGKYRVDAKVKAKIRYILNDDCPLADEWDIKHFKAAINYKAWKCSLDTKQEFHRWEHFRPSTILVKDNFYKYLEDIAENYSA